MNIKILDKETVSQIAAGEVVERPASVVKELVENSLDAGSSQIALEVQGGGVSFIKVMDNGSGIPAGEAEIAFERHATSRIASPSDLQSIASLGFRGEALPSIAAVAQVEMATCADGEKAGTYLSVEGGAVASRKSQARVRGTTITVRNLFRRVPARLKFLKSAPTENSHIAEVVSQYALAFPEVKFILSIDGKVKLETGGTGRLLDAVIDVYGVEIASRMLEIKNRNEDWASGDSISSIRVDGFIGAPELGRAGRGYLSFFVNRRWVNSRLMAAAVEEAYHGLLMTGKHPVAIINISLPPQAVDVNIHPAKSEVKFQNEGDVFRAVQKAVRQALLAQMPVPKIEEVATRHVSPPVYRHGIRQATERNVTPPPDTAPQPMMLSLPVLRVLGQILNSYIVAEGPDGLYLIDQHAAHERVRFEKVRQQRIQREQGVQALLEPATFEVNPRQDEILKSCCGELAEFGFSFEAFGPRTYLVRALPGILVGDDWAGMLRELLESLAGEARSHWAEKIVASIACHGAVRSGQALGDDEMHELVRELERVENPNTCPHGRPTMIHLSAAQLKKEFGRS